MATFSPWFLVKQDIALRTDQHLVMQQTPTDTYILISDRSQAQDTCWGYEQEWDIVGRRDVCMNIYAKRQKGPWRMTVVKQMYLEPRADTERDGHGNGMCCSLKGWEHFYKVRCN